MRIRDAFNSRVISLDRDACFGVMDDVKREIYAASALRPYVIVSFETCDYCDAAVLSAIVEAKRWLGNRLQIVIASDHVAQKIVSLLGWTDALRPRATLAETLLNCAARG